MTRCARPIPPAAHAAESRAVRPYRALTSPERSADGQTPVDCAVLVVTYNSADHIGALLASLPAAAEGLRLRTVVVDNGSTDGTIELLRSRSDVELIQSEANLGYAGGINLARRHAGPCASMAVLNPDLALEPGALRRLAQALRDPAVGVAVPLIVDGAGQLVFSLRREPSLGRALGDALFAGRFSRRPGWLSEIVRDEHSYRYRQPVEWATGAVMMLSAACDAAVGPWDERFFMYSEEVDHAGRARAAGFRMDYVPTAKARHLAGGSGSSRELIALMAVNRVRYIEKRDGRARLFRVLVTLHELLRLHDPAHRFAVRTLTRRSRWSHLPGGAATR